MAWRMIMALRKDSRDRMLCGVRFLAETTFVARTPVSSAMRIRVEETAAGVAPARGIMPRAAVMQAMVLAVPITPQVPTWRWC